jgi:hypothetical protein
MDHVVRFLAGGLIVSGFALLGDVLRPKSFAGLFGAAPSVALATLSLALWKEGAGYVATEARSMIAGSFALAAYSIAVCQLMMRFDCSAPVATSLTLLLWLAFAFGAKLLLLG